MNNKNPKNPTPSPKGKNNLGLIGKNSHPLPLPNEKDPRPLGIALEEGRDAHEQVIRSGCNSDVLVFTILVDMYAKWEHGGCWESVQQDAVTKCCLFNNHNIGTCEMLTRAEGIEIILTNASGRCAARP